MKNTSNLKHEGTVKTCVRCAENRKLESNEPNIEFHHRIALAREHNKIRLVSEKAVDILKSIKG